MERSLENVFNPRSVAVIGASEVPGRHLRGEHEV